MDRQAKRKFDEFKSDTDIESTYQPWLDLEANTLATQAGHAAPAPANVPVPQVQDVAGKRAGSG